MSNEEKETGLTRRDFVVGAGAVVGAMAMAATTGPAFAATENSYTATIPLRQPITDAMRRSVEEDLHMLKHCKNADLKKKAIEAWAIGLASSGYKRLSEVPGAAMPGIAELKHGGQNVHLNGVAFFARGIANHMRDLEKSVDIDDDVVLVGALCHDLGKPFEMDPANTKRWSADPSRVGYASMRHPIFGAHVAMLAGLPESIVHIAACHSAEGEKVVRSLECNIVVSADETWWKMTAAAGILKEDTIKGLIKRFEPRHLHEAFAHE